MSEYKYWKNLSDLARREMARLEAKGLTDLAPVFGDKTQEASEELRGRTVTSEARPVRLNKNQIVWVQSHGISITNHGYRPTEVSDRPLKLDIAIVAALTALKATTIDSPEAVRKVVPFVERWNEEETRLEGLDSARWWEEASESLDKIMREPRFRGHELTALQGLDPRVQQYLEYVKDLLRHYRPGFDDLPYEERIVLVEHTCRYMNGFLEALSKLAEFVEHGTPKGGISPAVENAARDVKAAELHDVAGLSYEKIAKIMGEPPPKKHAYKNDHPKVRKMGHRGREVLERAFGKEGWKAMAAAKKVEREHWLALSEGERWLERMSAIGTGFGMSLEEARAWVARIVDEKAQEQGITREEAALRWEERHKREGHLDELKALLSKPE